MVFKSIKGCIKCEENAIQVLSTLDHEFSPAMVGGKPVDVWYTLPISVRFSPSVEPEL